MLVEASGAEPAENVVIDVTRNQVRQRFKILSLRTPPISHEQPSGYIHVVPWVVAAEIPEFEMVMTGDRATATDTKLGYVYEFSLRQSVPFATLLPGSQSPPKDPSNLSRATAAVMKEAREKGLIPKG